MYSLARGLLLSLACLLQILNRVSAKIEITYPVAGTNYSASPYQIQWTSGSGDPSNITIYLATYNYTDVIINELRCLTWDTSAGSTYLSMSEAPPEGNSWAWMFYDTSQSLQLGQNQIAESAHFFFPGSLLPIPAGSTSKASHHSISAGAAAAIGIILTLALVAACLLAYFFLYRKRKGAVNINMGDLRPEDDYFKPELEGRDSQNTASRTQPWTHHEIQASSIPGLNKNELPAFARHELYGNTQGYHSSEIPVHYELPTRSPQNTVPSTIRRKEVPC